MEKEQIKILELIFSDAELIDIDFSKWDKYILFIVKSDHYKSYYTEDGFFIPIIGLKFKEVADLHFDFSHHERNTFHEISEKHYHWIIDQSSIDKIDKYYHLTFFQSGVMPKVFIKFKKVEIEEIDNKIFNQVNPDWENQYTGLARPSIFKLFEFNENNKRKK